MLKFALPLIVFIGISAFFAGCKKNTENSPETGILGSKTPPEIPSNYRFDVNGDTIDDFSVVYQWMTWDGINTSGDLISGEIEALNDNAVLRHFDTGYLFSHPGDTLFADVQEPYAWDSHFPAWVVSITTLPGLLLAEILAPGCSRQTGQLLPWHPAESG